MPKISSPSILWKDITLLTVKCAAVTVAKEKSLAQRSIFESEEDFITQGKIDSEYQRAESLASALKECEINCDWCGISMWDIYSIKIDGKPLMFYADDFLYYAVLLDKEEEDNISFEEQGDQTIPWRICHDALSNIYSVVRRTGKHRFGSNQLDFGEAELIVSFRKDTDGNIKLNRVEKICFTGFDKNELLDAIAYTNNNLYVPHLPRMTF